MAGQPKLDRGGMDTYRAALLLKCYSWHRQPSRVAGAQPTQEDVAKFYEEVEQLDTEDLRDFATAQLNQQVLSMFSHIRDVTAPAAAAAGAQPANSAEKKNPASKTGFSAHPHKPQDKNKSNGGASSSQAVAAASALSLSLTLTSKVGFRLECKPSKCSADAGTGVFIRCPPGASVAPGTLLAFFPGLVHLPEHTAKKDYLQDNLLPDPHFMLMGRLDNTVIDARTADACPPNPYALAHLVNHVPAGGLPNVQQYPYDFPADPLGYTAFPQDLQPFIPNAYALKPTFLGTHDRSALMRGVVLLAARPLGDGDELYMNYRLTGSGEQLPAWYVAYEPEKQAAEEAKQQ